MANRKSKKTEIAVSTGKRADLEILLRPPPVTLADYQAGNAAFRKGHRAFVADLLREDMTTAASMLADWADARKRQAEMGK